MPELILMWSAAVILGALALIIAGAALVAFSAALHEVINRWRIRGLTAAEVRYVRGVARRLRERRAAQEASGE